MSTKLDRPSKKSNKSALLAISGGVDSIVLLDALANGLGHRRKNTDTSKITDLINRFIDENNLVKIELAYADHLQRSDTDLDIKAIGQLAKKFDLKLNRAKLDLPKDSSEQLARDKRYRALEEIRQKRCLDHIITAHHADDVLETALINLTRGTGPKGISALRHQEEGLWRPFLYRLQEDIYITKQDILDYAEQQGLSWHEDSTNSSDKYLRNRIRHKLDQHSEEEKTKLLRLISNNLQLRQEISDIIEMVEMALATGSDQTYSIELFKDLPEEVKNQFLHTKINQNGFDVNKESVQRAREFIQTKTTGKVLQLKGCEIDIPEKRTFRFRSLGKKSGLTGANRAN